MKNHLKYSHTQINYSIAVVLVLLACGAAFLFVLQKSALPVMAICLLVGLLFPWRQQVEVDETNLVIHRWFGAVRRTIPLVNIIQVDVIAPGPWIGDIIPFIFKSYTVLPHLLFRTGVKLTLTNELVFVGSDEPKRLASALLEAKRRK